MGAQRRTPRLQNEALMQAPRIFSEFTKIASEATQSSPEVTKRGSLRASLEILASKKCLAPKRDARFQKKHAWRLGEKHF